MWDDQWTSTFSETLIFPRKNQWFWENERSQIVPHGSKSYKNRGLVTCGTISELPLSQKRWFFLGKINDSEKMDVHKSSHMAPSLIKIEGWWPSGTISELPFSSISSESLNFPSENQRFWENGCSQNVPHGTNPLQPLSCKRLAPSSTFWLFHILTEVQKPQFS